MGKHTQGEWELSGNGKQYQDSYMCPTKYYELGSKNSAEWIALVKASGFASDNEHAANAKLLAAAPDLLEALQAYVNNMLPSYSVDKWLEQYSNNDKADQVLIRAIQAIKKATT